MAESIEQFSKTECLRVEIKELRMTAVFHLKNRE